MIASKDWKNANKEQAVKHEANRRLKRQSEGVERLVNYLLDHPCLDCGEKDILTLEFDHLRDKEYCVASLAANCNWEKVLKEIDKCDVVCANCHRKRTHKRSNTLRFKFYEIARSNGR